MLFSPEGYFLRDGLDEAVRSELAVVVRTSGISMGRYRTSSSETSPEVGMSLVLMTFIPARWVKISMKEEEMGDKARVIVSGCREQVHR